MKLIHSTSNAHFNYIDSINVMYEGFPLLHMYDFVMRTDLGNNAMNVKRDRA